MMRNLAAIGRSRRPGTASVELVVVLPMLMLLIFGCIDFGRFSRTRIEVTNAAHAGASYGAMQAYTPATYPLWEANVKQWVLNEVSTLDGFDATLLVVNVSVVLGSSGQPSQVVVEVSYPFETVVDWPGLPSTMTLQQTAAMPSTRN